MRCICCFFLLTIIALAGLAAFLAAQIKVPQVDFNGIANHPSGLAHFSKTDVHAFDINLGLNIGVVNPNMASVKFEKITATAFYPTSPARPVGGGELSDLVINAHATTNFTFPFQIHYDHSKDEEQRMLLDITQKCGFTGGAKKDLVINYILTPTIRIIGFPLSVAIKNSVSLPCPPLTLSGFNNISI
ncbi:hypothetical protein BJV82DRAFT_619441 [Fennellomyces sp. T-0311]|nr:hypothetical protein BJV82DRAFT_619441 [Fennellomyces sp. T-0311]